MSAKCIIGPCAQKQGFLKKWMGTGPIGNKSTCRVYVQVLNPSGLVESSNIQSYWRETAQKHDPSQAQVGSSPAQVLLFCFYVSVYSLC